VLTGRTWHAQGTGYRTTLSYHWLSEGQVLEARNEVFGASGNLIARYWGTYAWDAGREEIVFWTVAEGGEVHRGLAWWSDGVLWHEAEVSGGGIEAYASAMRPAGDRLEYFAAYGSRRAGPELLKTEPIVYGPLAPDTLVRIDGTVDLAAEAAEAWRLLTTPAGLARWIAPESRVELELGGAYEIYFFPDSTDRGMEGTRVLGFIPEEMLAYTGELDGTWVVWRLEPLASEGGEPRTRVRFTALGRGEAWRDRSVYFREVTPEVLDRLQAAAGQAGASAPQAGP
jgi:uncharacterized protein YndB with AHSA1/START domain